VNLGAFHHRTQECDFQIGSVLLLFKPEIDFNWGVMHRLTAQLEVLPPNIKRQPC
jgi:hypothetical protein